MTSARVCACLAGFGPFGEHAVNASWIAVQVRPQLGAKQSPADNLSEPSPGCSSFTTETELMPLR